MKRTSFFSPSLPFLAGLSEVKMGSSSLNLCFNLPNGFYIIFDHSVTLVVSDMSKSV